MLTATVQMQFEWNSVCSHLQPHSVLAQRAGAEKRTHIGRYVYLNHSRKSGAPYMPSLNAFSIRPPKSAGVKPYPMISVVTPYVIFDRQRPSIISGTIE